MTNQKIIFLNKNILLYIFLFLCLIISLFTNFFHYDEAFYLFKVENLKSLNVYKNAEGRELFFRREYIYLLSKINNNLDIYDSYVLNRIISFFFAVISLVFLNKILNEFFKINKKYFFISYILFIYWYCFHPGGVSSRPDAISGFLTIFLIYSLFVSVKRSNYIFLHISIFINFLFFNWDPGKIIPLILLSFIAIVYLILKEKKLNLLLNFTISFIIFVILISNNIGIFYITNNLTNYLNIISSENFNSGDVSHISTYFSNFIKDFTLQGRFHHLKLFYIDTYYIILFLYFIVIWRIILYFKDNYTIENEVKILLLYFFYINFFLFLAPNKWLHHFTQIVVILCILLPSIIYTFERFTEFFKLKIKHFNIFLVLLILMKFYVYTSENLFLYKLLKSENSPLINLKVFNKMKIINDEMLNLKEKYSYKNINSNPIFKYIFLNSNYIGTENPKNLKYQPDLIILHSRKWSDETIQKFIRRFNKDYIFKKKIKFNNINWDFYSIK